VAGAKVRLLSFSHPVNLFYLSYVLAKSSGKEQITYELTGGFVLQIALSDVERYCPTSKRVKNLFLLIW